MLARVVQPQRWAALALALACAPALGTAATAAAAAVCATAAAAGDSRRCGHASVSFGTRSRRFKSSHRDTNHTTTGRLRSPSPSPSTSPAFTLYPTKQPAPLQTMASNTLQLGKGAANVCPSLTKTLAEEDPDIYALVELEKWRQYSGLELIASENFTSAAVMEANGSALTNKYSEGLPAARYYGGNEYIDLVENLCRERALAAFRLDPKVWGVNVQPYSGSQANFAAYTALLAPHDRIMGLDLPSGGHLTHGYATARKRVSASAIFFESMPYRVDPATGLVDYDELERGAMVFRPRLIVCGASAYARDWDYARLRKIADSIGNNCMLMSDMAHISGLVAAEEQKSPFDYADIVTTTTHKTLRGPRAGLIFFRRTRRVGNEEEDIEAKVNAAVFPATQGGPHNNTIAAIAVALKQAATPEFRAYAQQIRRNATTLAESLKRRGHSIVTSGTDNHIVLWDLRNHRARFDSRSLSGNKFEALCDRALITLNKNTVHGDTSALVPGGVRLGAPALTSRGFKESDFEHVAELLHGAFEIAAKGVISAASNTVKDFIAVIDDANGPLRAEILALRSRVVKFARGFPMPGFDPAAVDLKLLAAAAKKHGSHIDLEESA